MDISIYFKNHQDSYKGILNIKYQFWIFLNNYIIANPTELNKLEPILKIDTFGKVEIENNKIRQFLDNFDLIFSKIQKFISESKSIDVKYSKSIIILSESDFRIIELNEKIKINLFECEDILLQLKDMLVAGVSHNEPLIFEGE